MTVTNQTNKTIQLGDGTTTTFNFSFPIFQASDLKVYKYLTSSTATTHTPLTITTDYTVVISSTTEGGSVTFVVTPLATETIAIVRDLSYTQTTDIDLNGNFPEVDVENALDKNSMLTIQLKEQTDRALVISQFTSTTIGGVEAPEDRRALIFSDNGDGSFDVVNSEYDPDTQVAGATAQAGIATTQAGLASGYATQSAGYRDEAEDFKDEAEAAAASINGDPLWNATKTFIKGDVTTVIVSDIPYKYYNLTGTNTATSPQSDATNWAFFTDKDRGNKNGSDFTLSALAATAISNVRKILTPNLAAGASFTRGNTTTVDGFIQGTISGSTGTRSITVDSVVIWSWNQSEAVYAGETLPYFVPSGSVVTTNDAGFTLTFYPCKTL